MWNIFQVKNGRKLLQDDIGLITLSGSFLVSVHVFGQLRWLQVHAANLALNEDSVGIKQALADVDGEPFLVKLRAVDALIVGLRSWCSLLLRNCDRQLSRNCWKLLRLCFCWCCLRWHLRSVHLACQCCLKAWVASLVVVVVVLAHSDDLELVSDVHKVFQAFARNFASSGVNEIQDVLQVLVRDVLTENYDRVMRDVLQQQALEERTHVGHNNTMARDGLAFSYQKAVCELFFQPLVEMADRTEVLIWDGIHRHPELVAN